MRLQQNLIQLEEQFGMKMVLFGGPLHPERNSESGSEAPLGDFAFPNVLIDLIKPPIQKAFDQSIDKKKFTSVEKRKFTSACKFIFACVCMDLLATIISQYSARGLRYQVAVIDEGRVWTYEDLFATASSIRARFPATISASSSPIAILMEKTGIFVASTLAALAAGHAFIPLDAQKTPRERVLQILAKASVGLLITEITFDGIYISGKHFHSPQ